MGGSEGVEPDVDDLPRTARMVPRLGQGEFFMAMGDRPQAYRRAGRGYGWTPIARRWYRPIFCSSQTITPMSLIIIIIILLLLFGGWRIRLSRHIRGKRGGGLGLVLVILLVLYLMGYIGPLVGRRTHEAKSGMC